MRAWSPAAEAKLRALYATTTLARLAFLLKRTQSAVKSRAAVMRLSKGTRRPWTAKDRAVLRKRYPHEHTAGIARDLQRSARTVYQQARSMGLSKSAKYLASGAACRFNGHEPGSVASRFKKGHVPANKGLRRPGWAPGRMATTQFKKGQMAGAAQRNYVPIGSTRIVYGNLERKVSDDPNVYPAARWKPVHRLVWEAANGPIPRGHLVVFKPGRHTIAAKDITLDRLELVDRAENMRRNTRHRFPPELNQLIALKAALTRKINTRSRQA